MLNTQLLLQAQTYTALPLGAVLLFYLGKEWKQLLWLTKLLVGVAGVFILLVALFGIYVLSN